MSQQITISAPSRIHFGLFSVGNVVERRFGGLGLMIDEPRTVVEFSDNEFFAIKSGDTNGNARIQSLAQSWFDHYAKLLPDKYPELEQLPVAIRLVGYPTPHFGLGSGTQLAMTMVTGLSHLLGLGTPSPEESAGAMDRGKRSAIGTYGFYEGGFLIDRGKTESEQLSPLDLRIDFPESWRIVLIRPATAAGLSGAMELEAFGRILASSERQREILSEIARNRIVPSIMNNDFSTFANAIHEFGFQSGRLFESVQGGPYNGSEIMLLVDKIRKLGFPAVGQSSWGPTVYAIAESESAAQELVNALQPMTAARFKITSADNAGFRFTKRELSNELA